MQRLKTNSCALGASVDPLKGLFFLFKGIGILHFCKSAVTSAESYVPVGEPDEVLPSTSVSVS